MNIIRLDLDKCVLDLDKCVKYDVSNLVGYS